MGLISLGLHSIRNLGLLLHLLGLSVPDDALRGLDGVLIGLRTRELLQQLLEARCRLSPVVMVIEDLHWIDSASEELLSKIVEGDAKLRFLLLHTRRPEYRPHWRDRPVVTKLLLEPLAAGDIRHLVNRFGIDGLPDTVARQVTDKAEGNPLFAEEIVSFLAERGILHTKDGKLEFDAVASAAALPASVQSLLSARVDRLAQKDRTLLQAASVIGRQFDAELLAAILKETDVDERLAAMQALDLIYLNDRSSYTFKHALVRDALYQSILTEQRQELHSKIAEEIERRSGNRLTEVAEFWRTITVKPIVPLNPLHISRWLEAKASMSIHLTMQQTTLLLRLPCSMTIKRPRRTIRSQSSLFHICACLIFASCCTNRPEVIE